MDQRARRDCRGPDVGSEVTSASQVNSTDSHIQCPQGRAARFPYPNRQDLKIAASHRDFQWTWLGRDHRQLRFEEWNLSGSECRNPSHAFYADSRNGNVAVNSPTFSQGGFINGDVGTNGGHVTAPPARISGVVDNAISFTGPPVKQPSPTYKSGSANTASPATSKIFAKASAFCGGRRAELACAPLPNSC
jgi:hypothetical protein